jgi:hypothetical protein
VRRIALTLTLALAATSCSDPVPPPVSVRQPSLDADDLAVMKGVLDDMRERLEGASFLVVDTTIAVCAGPIEVVAPPPGGCLAAAAVDSVSKVLPLRSRVTSMFDFQARNAIRLAIAGELGADVTYVSATLIDFVSLDHRPPPHQGAIVTFSAPSYPAPRTAVISYRVKDAEDVALRLEQQSDGRWVVATRLSRS